MDVTVKRERALGDDAREPSGPYATVDRLLGHPGFVAVAVWAVTMPLAATVPAVIGIDPFEQRRAVVPLAIGGLVLAVAAFAGWLRRSDALVGAAAGLFAAFVVLVLRSSLHGTPFAFQGVTGDSARLYAMVTRYSVTWHSADGIVAAVPAEYPPLFPWVLGRIAALTGAAPWRLVAPGEVFAISAAVIASFTLWLRLVSAPVALAISALGLVTFGEADKAYEVLALAVVIPWILLTFAAPPANRPHWLASGIVGGLMVLTYHAYLVFSIVAVAVLVVRAWRSSEDRRAYVIYLGKVAGTMAVLSSWYVIPYLWALLTGGQQVGDMYTATEISENPFPFLSMTPLGLVQIAGLAGLLFYRRSAWWARAILLILLSAYIYRVIGMARYVANAHTGLFYYTTPLISMCLVVGCVLAVSTAAPALARRLGTVVPAGTGLIVTSLIVAFAGFMYWAAWMPVATWDATDAGLTAPNANDRARSNYLAAQAHAQAYPDGGRPVYTAGASQVLGLTGGMPWFPTTPIQRTVEGVLGKGARPRTLSYNEELFAFLPWRGYLGVDRNASMAPVRWDARFDALYRLSLSRDLTGDSAHTAFGPIDVFVLHQEGGALVWQPLRKPTVLRFTAAQFDPARWTVAHLPGDTFVAVRRPWDTSVIR